MRRRPPRSTQGRSSAASDVYKRQVSERAQETEHHVGADGAERMLVAEGVPPVGRSVDHRGHGFSGGHRTSNPARRRSCASSLVSIEPMRSTVRTESGPSGYVRIEWTFRSRWLTKLCLLYTSDAADDLLCVDLGGRRII